MNDPALFAANSYVWVGIVIGLIARPFLRMINRSLYPLSHRLVDWLEIRIAHKEAQRQLRQEAEADQEPNPNPSQGSEHP